MMQNIKIRWVLWIFTLLIYANANSQSVGNDNVDYLKNSFTTKKLSTFQLEGFETRATQKINDFGDYIKVISDKSYDLELRKHALKMFAELFETEHVLIKNPDKEISNKKEINVTEFAEQVIGSNYTKIETEITGVKITKPLKQDKRKGYIGELSFNQITKYYKKEQLIKKSSSKKKADIILKKKIKKFGNKKEEVWNIYLGNVISE